MRVCDDAQRIETVGSSRPLAFPARYDPSCKGRTASSILPDFLPLLEMEMEGPEVRLQDCVVLTVDEICIQCQHRKKSLSCGPGPMAERGIFGHA